MLLYFSWKVLLVQAYILKDIQCNSQFENIWNVARGFGNMLAEANGGVDNALDKMSCKGIKDEEKEVEMVELIDIAKTIAVEINSNLLFLKIVILR